MKGHWYWKVMYSLGAASFPDFSLLVTQFKQHGVGCLIIAKPGNETDVVANQFLS